MNNMTLVGHVAHSELAWCLPQLVVTCKNYCVRLRLQLLWDEIVDSLNLLNLEARDFLDFDTMRVIGVTVSDARSLPVSIPVLSCDSVLRVNIEVVGGSHYLRVLCIQCCCSAALNEEALFLDTFFELVLFGYGLACL